MLKNLRLYKNVINYNNETDEREEGSNPYRKKIYKISIVKAFLLISQPLSYLFSSKFHDKFNLLKLSHIKWFFFVVKITRNFSQQF